MLYAFYEMQRAAVAPMRAGARLQRSLWSSTFNPLAGTVLARTATAAADVFESVTRRYGKPEWGITSTRVNGVEVPVSPVAVHRETWCDLVYFERDPAVLDIAAGPRVDPRVLIIAPMSGHYATLLRDTVEAFLPDHEVFITDWADARMAPVYQGRFDLNDYIDAVRRMIAIIGPGGHVASVCQPGPATLAAIALMSEDGDAGLPASMTFMGSPIDARRSPTQPNVLAEEKPFEWFERRMIHTVPAPYPGAFRRVYPGFVQLASFMNMNWDRHVDAHHSFFNHLVAGDGDSAAKHSAFYDEYLSVMDLTAEFYLQTIDEVFQRHLLARGELYHRGRRVNPDAIDAVGLMTVEGENDDISGIGQTQAAHDICPNIPARRKIDYVQPGVGHYGVFSGRRFRTEIYPRIRDHMRDGYCPDLELEHRASGVLG